MNNMAILCPIQNGAAFNLNWIQTRPRVSQSFGLNPQIYKQFGLKGHNGVDLAIPVKTPVFAPMDGIARVYDSGYKKGYGLHIRIRNAVKPAEIILAHLNTFSIPDGQHVNMGDLIGNSGNTGFSTGPHLHIGMRLLKEDKNKPIFDWAVLDYNNGYFGYFDIEPFMLTWKGTLLENSI